jgi:hypothetical protein
MQNQISRGFTVIRQSDGAVEFGLGVIEIGKRPASPYRVAESGRQMLANERTEVHQNQREFVGPFQVEDDDQAMYLTVSVEGAPGVDILVVSKAVGDAWLQTYTRQPAPTALPGYANLDEGVFSGALWRRTVALRGRRQGCHDQLRSRARRRTLAAVPWSVPNERRPPRRDVWTLPPQRPPDTDSTLAAAARRPRDQGRSRRQGGGRRAGQPSALALRLACK